MPSPRADPAGRTEAAGALQEARAEGKAAAAPAVGLMKLHLKQQNELVVNALMLESSGERE